MSTCLRRFSVPVFQLPPSNTTWIPAASRTERLPCKGRGCVHQPVRALRRPASLVESRSPVARLSSRSWTPRYGIQLPPTPRSRRSRERSRRPQCRRFLREACSNHLISYMTLRSAPELKLTGSSPPGRRKPRLHSSRAPLHTSPVSGPRSSCSLSGKSRRSKSGLRSSTQQMPRMGPWMPSIDWETRELYPPWFVVCIAIWPVYCIAI